MINFLFILFHFFGFDLMGKYHLPYFNFPHQKSSYPSKSYVFNYPFTSPTTEVPLIIHPEQNSPSL
jgi:hypothetical protein